MRRGGKATANYYRNRGTTRQILKQTRQNWPTWSSTFYRPTDQSSDRLAFCTGRDQRTWACRIIQTLPCPITLLLFNVYKTWLVQKCRRFSHTEAFLETDILAFVLVTFSQHDVHSLLSVRSQKPYFLYNVLLLSTAERLVSVEIAQNREMWWEQGTCLLHAAICWCYSLELNSSHPYTYVKH